MIQYLLLDLTSHYKLLFQKDKIDETTLFKHGLQAAQDLVHERMEKVK
jgi:hypothetical protein